MELDEILGGILVITTVLFVIFLVIVIPIYLFLADVGITTGSGQQIGYIAEVEENGIFWRPAEVKLLNIQPTFSEEDTSWHYGIEKEIVEEARGYVNSNKPVIVYYETRMLVWYWDYSNRVVITRIEQFNNTK